MGGSMADVGCRMADGKPTRIRRAGLRDRLPEGAKLITRGTRFGNPFRVELHGDGEGGRVYIVVDLLHEKRTGDALVLGEWPGNSDGRMAARTDAVRRFREWVMGDSSEAAAMRIAARTVLRGRDLACACDFGGPCHGDVLLEVANGE